MPRTVSRFASVEIGARTRIGGSLNRQNSMPMASRATPAVATSNVTRGASNSGRTMSRSVSSPMTTPATIPRAMAAAYGRSA
jgi:hypothetical protein